MNMYVSFGSLVASHVIVMLVSVSISFGYGYVLGKKRG